MIEDLQIRNLTPNTQRVYVAQIVHFACHFRKSPDLLGHLTSGRIGFTSRGNDVSRPVRSLSRTPRCGSSTVTLKRPWIVQDDTPPAVRRRSFRLC